MEHDQKVKTKMVQEQGLLVKMKFLLCYNVKIVMWWGNESIGGIPSPSRENPDFTVLGQGRAADANQTILWLPPKRHDFCLL